MPKRHTYIDWTPHEVELLLKHGPHLPLRDLEKLIPRHTRPGIAAKLRHKAIRKTKARLRVAASEGILGAAAKQMRCGDCGSSNLVATCAGFGREELPLRSLGQFSPAS